MSTTLTSPSSGALQVWVIFRNEQTYPGLVCVQRWESFYGVGDPITDALVRTHPTIEAARKSLPDGLRSIGKSPEDDPAVLETWL